MVDDIDELDNDNTNDIQQPIKKKEQGISNKLDDLPNGIEDCYWCGRAFEEKTIQRRKVYGVAVYICKDCQ